MPERFEFLLRERMDIASGIVNELQKSFVSSFELIDAPMEGVIAVDMSFSVKIDNSEEEIADFFDEV